jgi:protein gp37
MKSTAGSALMAAKSPIEWTEATWNPVTGCDKVSPGCAHCYAERMARRPQAMGQRNYLDGFRIRTHEHMLEHPFRWKRPLRVFVRFLSSPPADYVKGSRAVNLKGKAKKIRGKPAQRPRKAR